MRFGLIKKVLTVILGPPACKVKVPPETFTSVPAFNDAVVVVVVAVVVAELPEFCVGFVHPDIKRKTIPITTEINAADLFIFFLLLSTSRVFRSLTL